MFLLIVGIVFSPDRLHSWNPESLLLVDTEETWPLLQSYDLCFHQVPANRLQEAGKRGPQGGQSSSSTDFLHMVTPRNNDVCACCLLTTYILICNLTGILLTNGSCVLGLVLFCFAYGAADGTRTRQTNTVHGAPAPGL